MKAIARVVTVTLGGIIIAAGFASAATAGCANPSPLASPSWLTPGPGAWFGKAPTALSTATRTPDDGAAIVGLWQFTMTSDGNNVAPFFIPDGARLDAGYAQWHSDGTEIMNSSRDPATTNFCLGVWKSEGARTYKLNHFALSWDNTGALCVPPAGTPSCFVGPTNIREEVTVDPHGNTYMGTVTIDQYDTSGHLLFRLKGNVAAQRIVAD